MDAHPRLTASLSRWYQRPTRPERDAKPPSYKRFSAKMDPTNILAASADSHPLIDLDMTVFVQLVIFLIASFVASRSLFRPYLRMRDDRAAGIEGAREEASAMSAQADAQLADYEQKLAGARSRAQEERRNLRAEAGAHEREVLDKTRVEAADALNKAQADIASQTEKARTELAPRADEIARAMASKLLGREVA